MSEQKPTIHRSDEVAAQYAELILASGFRAINDRAAEMADNDGEKYREWRENMDEHLGGLAASIVDKRNMGIEIWERQRLVALALLQGKSLGPFADYAYKLTVEHRPVEVEPTGDEKPLLLPGEPEVVTTNNRVQYLSNDIEEPIEFLDEALQVVLSRRRRGDRFEGPENYATALKFFTDKTFDHPIDSAADEKVAKELINDALGNFLRVSKRDKPNVIEMTNILSSIKNLPPDMVDKKHTKLLLVHILETMDDFSQRGLNVVMGALSKLDMTECGEPGAMTVDLTLRRGAKWDRSRDMLSALRAVANLPKTSAGERAFTTLLDVRNSLELSADLENLRQINRMLRYIVDNVTDNENDSLRAKKVAEVVAHRAVKIHKDMAKTDKTDTERARRVVASILRDANAI